MLKVSQFINLTLFWFLKVIIITNFMIPNKKHAVYKLRHEYIVYNPESSFNFCVHDLIKCVKLRFSQVLMPLLYQIYLDIILVAYLLKLNTISTVHVSFVGSDKKKRKRWSSRRFQTGRAMSNFMEVPRTEWLTAPRWARPKKKYKNIR